MYYRIKTKCKMLERGFFFLANYLKIPPNPNIKNKHVKCQIKISMDQVALGLTGDMILCFFFVWEHRVCNSYHVILWFHKNGPYSTIQIH